MAKMKAADWQDLLHFRPGEEGLAGVAHEMDYMFMMQLDEAREEADVPFKISSSYREGDPRAHGYGRAVDIKCIESRLRSIIVTALLKRGFTRIGIYNKHIHVDNMTEAEGFPEDVMWWGTSR